MARRALKPGQVPTRDAVVHAAAVWFGDHGFDGCTLREVAVGLGVTAPTLLHHVGSKEKLFARVLEHVNASLISALVAAVGDGSDPRDLAASLDAYLAWMRANPAYARLLMRELIDNRTRAATRGYWPLGGIVKRGAKVVRKSRGGTDVEAAMIMVLAIGAVSYFATAEPTIRRVLNVSATADLDTPFRAALRLTIHAGSRRMRRTR